ncbi:ArsR/SmtB family transcription factor [Natrinema salsiterrestre]|uniref:Helix-turn-helix domain-containing protein n=1 Tax=Natrinema salsiterrestre TaxID=2950540 RepID=A0A9Q4L3D6_9EURY|nr:helix-turn-helix domain-containing protein [Natrinema salsiterrestre]MDF9744596.1 helix-turn-helix domain-containing protein [Natrinema salsiterrestre]
MARLFPFRSETAVEEGQPRVVDLEGEDADAVFGALSSTTARQIYSRLDDDPGTPSDVADAIDSSIQNVRYHLEKLEDAGLVEVVDTWYSSRGNEMSVYSTTDGPLIVTSDESRATRLKEALSRLIGGIGALAGGSLLVQYTLTRWLGPSGSMSANSGAQSDGAGGGDGSGSSDGSTTETTEEADDYTVTDVGENDTTSADDGGSGDALATDQARDGGSEGVQNASDGGAEAAEAVLETVPPGLLFFLGGLAVLLAVVCYWYWYRPAYR